MVLGIQQLYRIFKTGAHRTPGLVTFNLLGLRV